jgi:hypothetical protein
MVKIKNYIYFIRGAGGHYFLERELNIKMKCDSLNEYTPSDSQNKVITVEQKKDIDGASFEDATITSCTNPKSIWFKYDDYEKNDATYFYSTSHLSSWRGNNSVTNPKSLWKSNQIEVENFYCIICNSLECYIWCNLLWLSKKYLKEPKEYNEDFIGIINLSISNWSEEYKRYKKGLLEVKSFGKFFKKINYDDYFFNTTEQEILEYSRKNLTIVKKFLDFCVPDNLLLNENLQYYEKLL